MLVRLSGNEEQQSPLELKSAPGSAIMFPLASLDLALQTVLCIQKALEGR